MYGILQAAIESDLKRLLGHSTTIVPDFPLVNKSFNLSYAGNDL